MNDHVTISTQRRGGQREGAGRPTADGAENLKRVNVMLDEDTIERAKRVGNGNLSLGIRRAFETSG